MAAVNSRQSRLKSAAAFVCDRLLREHGAPRWQLQSLESRVLLSAGGPESSSGPRPIEHHRPELIQPRTQELHALPRAAYAGAQNKDLYDRWLVVSPTASSAVQAIVEDVTAELRKMTGRDYNTVTKTTGRGIFLVHADDAGNYPALASHAARLAQLAGKGPEAFYIHSDGDRSLWIVGNSDQAIRHGSYFYLQQLGWRALLPGDNWTIRPDLDDITIVIDQVEEPDYRERDFFGTGGFGGSLPLDSTGKTQAAWARWKQANLFGGSIDVAGHMGEAFNTEYKTWLEANDQARPLHLNPNYDPNDPNSPQYIRAPWSVSMKPDDTYQPYLDLLIDDRRDAYDPQNPSKYVSVEPSDGGGFAQNPEYYQYQNDDSPPVVLDTVEDHVFNVANEVARALADLPVPGRASVLAYNHHAGIPDLQLEDNLHVRVIPYAFQRTGLLPRDLLEAWAAKHDDVSVYDYWSIPDWTHDLPSGSFNSNMSKFQHWTSLGYDAFNGESSIAAGSIGMLWYVTSRLMWDNGADVEQLKEEFYDLSFGPAKGPMARLIDRWNEGFRDDPQEIATAWRDIAAARSLAASDPAALARVNDFARYVGYIQHYHEYENAGAVGTPGRHQAADDLLRYMWSTYDSHMVSTYRMAQLIRNRYDAADTVLAADWNPDDPSAAGWASVTPLGDDDIADLVADGMAAYPLLIDLPEYSDTLVPLSNNALDGVMIETATQLGLKLFQFKAPAGETQLDFEVNAYNYLADPDLRVTVTVTNSAGNTVYGPQEYDDTGSYQPFTVNVTGGETYTMRVDDPKKSFRLKVERHLPFVMTSPLTSTYQVAMPPAYFYVPAGQQSVALGLHSATAVVIKDASGTVVTPSSGNGKGFTIYPVGSGQDNQLWNLTVLKEYSPGTLLINAPQAWSFSPTGMMVPVNHAPTVHAGWDGHIVHPTNSIALVGDIVDDGISGTAVTATWTKVSGPGTVTFGNAHAAATTATFSAYGTYVLRLTADDGAASAHDEVTIQYLASAPNQAPVVDAGSYGSVSLPSATYNLDGTVSDDGKPIPTVGYAWTVVRGPGRVVFGDDEAVDTTATFDAPGEYVLRLAADDSQRAAYDEVKVTVLPDYSAPTYKVGDAGTFGNGEAWGYTAVGMTLNSTDDEYSARFRALEGVTVDRVYQRFASVGVSVRVEVGIMADDGNGNPSGTYLASSGSFDPDEGFNWATFTSSVTLIPMQVYHVVTRITQVDLGQSMKIHSSATSESIRPFDRATDTFMNVMTRSNGGNWNAAAGDPYFTLGNGATVVGGPGQPYQSSAANYLNTQGGTGRAMGQKFTLGTREVPVDSKVSVSALKITVYRSAATTGDLVIDLRDSSGAVLGTITRSAASIATISTAYTWAFDGATTVTLLPGQSYYLTTAVAGGGTTTDNYYFPARTPGNGNGNASWGGMSDAYPMRSGTSNNWTAWPPAMYIGREMMDLVFSFQGEVEHHDPVYDIGQTGTFGNNISWGYTVVGMTLNSLDDEYAARFRPLENLTIDRAFQRLIAIDPNTRLEVGIMADDGAGNPDGRFLTSTGSYDPADGDSLAWAVFTEPVDLEAGQIYHLVTRITELGGDEWFRIYASATTEGIRPYDRGSDPFMNTMTRSNGGNWNVTANDPYFVLGNGSTLIGGPGQPYQIVAANYLNTQGGTGRAMGQKFTLSANEVPINSQVVVSEMNITVYRSAATTGDLVIDLRDSSGAVLGTITVPAANVATTSTQYTWAFDGGATVTLRPGQGYYLTTAVAGGGTTTDNYYFPARHPGAGNGDATWGGMDKAYPIRSGTSNSWTTWPPAMYSGREMMDLVFSFQGEVEAVGSPLKLAGEARASGGSATKVTAADVPSIASEAIRRWKAAGLDRADVKRLIDTPITIADLSGDDLARVTGGRITLDHDAAGAGWFIDPTRRNDREFKGRRAPEGVDLLTALMHEYGHRLNQPHVQSGLMQPELPAGVRRSPEPFVALAHGTSAAAEEQSGHRPSSPFGLPGLLDHDALFSRFSGRFAWCRTPVEDSDRSGDILQ